MSRLPPRPDAASDEAASPNVINLDEVRRRAEPPPPPPAPLESSAVLEEVLALIRVETQETCRVMQEFRTDVATVGSAVDTLEEYRRLLWRRAFLLSFLGGLLGATTACILFAL